MKRLVIALAALFACLSFNARAQELNAQEQAEVRAVVRDYLINNPDVLREALDALSAREAEQRKLRIVSDRRDFMLGSANAPITIVEFFDYRCPYCHAALEWVEGVAASRRDVRIIFKELPVLGPQSLEAAQASLAAQPQGHYWDFHKALMSYRGDLTSDEIDRLARGAGIDVARMRRDMNNPAVLDHLNDNNTLAVNSNITGTPGFMINGELVSGFNRDRMEAMLRRAEQNVGRQTAER